MYYFNGNRSFLDEYNEKIAPKLINIDIMLKSDDYTLSVSKISKALDISNDEVFSIMGKLHLSNIDKRNFFSIMRNGSSNICKLFIRELNCNSPVFYKPEQIAYIYELDETCVCNAFSFLNLDEADEKLLPEIFSKIIVE